MAGPGDGENGYDRIPSPVQGQVDLLQERDFDRLLQVLAPDVVFWFDSGPGPAALHEIVGARAVAREILRTAPRFLPHALSIMVNGAPGVLHGTMAEPLCVLGCTVARGRIAQLHLVADAAKLHR